MQKFCSSSGHLQFKIWTPNFRLLTWLVIYPYCYLGTTGLSCETLEYGFPHATRVNVLFPQSPFFWQASLLLQWPVPDS